MRNLMLVTCVGTASLLALPLCAQDAPTQQDPSKTIEVPAGTPHIDGHMVTNRNPNATNLPDHKKLESATKSEPAKRIAPAKKKKVDDDDVPGED